MWLRVLKIAGILSCITLGIVCFLPWTYHADINKTFTGFFSEQNMYGKPGKFLIFFAACSLVLMLLPKVWAKRIHLFFSAIAVGYAIKTYILFTSCYNAYCPEKKYGIYIMMICCIIILTASIFPDLKLNKANNSSNKI